VSDHDWDPAKERRNIRKHGIPFIEAQSVLADPARWEVVDGRHHGPDHRIVALGWSDRARLLVVIGSDLEGRPSRIMSARRATKRERHEYERRR
jgi:uncharacterized DUF497 family protein